MSVKIPMKTFAVLHIYFYIELTPVDQKIVEKGTTHWYYSVSKFKDIQSKMALSVLRLAGRE